MSTSPSDLERDDVLDAFSMESAQGKETLDRYIREYPQFAVDLIDLSRELMRSVVVDEAPLSAADLSKLDTAWSRHVAAQPLRVTDPFAAMSPVQSREIATSLNVPRQVITAFRERKVLLDSVPRAFLRRFAGAANVAVNEFIAGLAWQPELQAARSYKAAGKPGSTEQVTFERILIDAGVSDERRAELLADDT